MKLSRVFAVSLVSLLAACHSIPHSVQGEVTPVSIDQARSNPQSHKVRWGGVIARVENQEKQSVIEVVALPLNSSTRPEEVDSTSGRFLAIVPEFVDPLVYEKGREITVIGELSDLIEGKIGDMKYLFPVVRVSGHHLWKKRPLIREVNYYPSTFWPHFPHHYYYGHPHWHYYPRLKQQQDKLNNPVKRPMEKPTKNNDK